MTDTEAAALLSLSRDYLRTLRVRGGGPVFSKMAGGRAVRYRISVVMAWGDSASVTSTSQYRTVH